MPRLAVAAVVVLSASLARGADPTLVSPGNIRFAKIANSAFDVYTQNPTQAQKDWMRAHYWRMLTYAPYFDSRLSWFPDAWVYKDLYAIYPGSTVATAHPEWILKDASGNRLYIPYGCGGGTCPQYAADIGSPEFRTSWIQEATATLAKGYRGLFVDDVNMLLDRVSNGSGQPVTPIDPRTGNPMSQADWRRYMADFTDQIRQAFPAKEIVHNVLWWVGTSDASVARELVAADFICLERGFNDSGIVGGTGTYGFDTFVGLVDWLHQRGRAVFFDPSATTAQSREYGLASYFLVSSGTDSTTNDAGGGTPADWWTGYDVGLGNASGGRYTWNGLRRRDFERGIVLVNPPGASSLTVQLGATYTDLAGAQRTSVTLGPAQGAVLRRNASPPPSAPPTLIDLVPVPD